MWAAIRAACWAIRPGGGLGKPGGAPGRPGMFESAANGELAIDMPLGVANGPPPLSLLPPPPTVNGGGERAAAEVRGEWSKLLFEFSRAFSDDGRSLPGPDPCRSRFDPDCC